MYGARLELSPLTVLCGKNGSGKLTWMKVLNLLRDALQRDILPFDFGIVDYESADIQLLNAFYYLASTDCHADLANSDSTTKFGPPGTIGLEIVATRAVCFDTQQGEEAAFRGLPQEFLRLGRCPEGTRFRLRFAHPGYCYDDEATPELNHLVELQVNDRFVIRMTRERDLVQSYESGQGFPLVTKPYQARLLSSFRP